jgi:hypothetical protein
METSDRSDPDLEKYEIRKKQSGSYGVGSELLAAISMSNCSRRTRHLSRYCDEAN